VGWHDEARTEGPGVVLGRATNLGRPTWWVDDFWPLNTTLYVTDFMGNDPRFAYYVFEGLDLSGFDSGSVQPMLNRNYVAKVPLVVPPLPEQRSIAEVLGSLDDKIESNRRLQQVAHELLQAIFASALERDGRPWESACLTAELGTHLAVVESGKRPPGGVRGFREGVPSIGAESVTRAGQFTFSKVKFIPREFFAAMRRGVVADRDVLLYKDGGTPGNFEPHVSMVGQGFPFKEAAINEHVYRLRARPPFSQDFLYAWLSAPETMEEMRRRGTGAAIPSLNSANLRTMPFPQPDRQALEAAQREAEPVMTALLQSAAESNTLAELRDTLLPELLSGRLRVPVAEELVEAAT
jgi:type I restriction enzyme S subunit